MTKIFIDGQGTLAQSITRKLIENHHIAPDDLLINTYEKFDNIGYINWLDHYGITWFSSDYRNSGTHQTVADFAPDYIMSAYGLRILPKSVLDLAKICSFNLHPAYLPDYKGRWIAPWVILNGETEHGITFHLLNEHIDCGDILYQKRIPVASDDTAYSLYHKLLSCFVQEFDNFFDLLVQGKLNPVAQSGTGRYYSPAMPHNGIIDPSWDQDYVEKFIRAMYFPPHTGARVEVNNCLLECNTLKDYLDIKLSNNLTTI